MIRISSEDPQSYALLGRALSRGGVAVLPTDTIYGFSTPLSSRAGHDRVEAIKGGAGDRRFLYLACGLDMVERYIEEWGCGPRDVMARVWPAPVTAVFRSGAVCPAWASPTVAFRVPAEDRLRGAIEALGEPILSTSVNEAGERPLDDPDEIERRFGSRCDLLLDGGRLAGAGPSTLVDFTGPSPLVLRRGVYVWDGGGKPSK
jgi:tRNA threonylcarbamoyl adenosine modification protein (Sua5/YciO/YrdC/YwlC family)